MASATLTHTTIAPVTISDLEPDVLVIIAKQDFRVFKALLKINPCGLKLCNPYAQKALKKVFTKRIRMINYLVYMVNGVVHRHNGPAMYIGDECERYYINGKLHREDGPAVRHKDGNMEYWFNNIRYTDKTFRYEYDWKKQKWIVEQRNTRTRRQICSN